MCSLIVVWLEWSSATLQDQYWHSLCNVVLWNSKGCAIFSFQILIISICSALLCTKSAEKLLTFNDLSTFLLFSIFFTLQLQYPLLFQVSTEKMMSLNYIVNYSAGDNGLISIFLHMKHKSYNSFSQFCDVRIASTAT